MIKKIIANDIHTVYYTVNMIFFSVNAELGSHSSCWIGVVVRSRYIGVGQEISSGNRKQLDPNLDPGV